jgi:hypothetical protein
MGRDLKSAGLDLALRELSEHVFTGADEYRVVVPGRPDQRLHPDKRRDQELVV